MAEPAIGIDLGTTYSCVGVIKEGNVEIVADETGKRIIPSVVSFLDTAEEGKAFSVVVGDVAKKEEQYDPISCSKRLIGRTFDDPYVQEDLRIWPFKVINKDGKPTYQVTINGKIHTFHPEEISAQILKKMKSIAENYLGRPVKKAVIGVPAYFSENQKQATKDAATIAGLEVLELVSEPTAAAIAYGADLQAVRPRNMLVFDYGGGTFDVSIIQVENGKIKVLAIDGHPHLGGEDIDNTIALSFEENFNRRHNTQVRADNPKAWRRLKHQAEKVKIALSQKPLENIRVDYFHKDQHLQGSISRARLETLADEEFRKTILKTEEVISASKLKKGEIHDVLLVGGSTKIPKVQKLVRELLPNARIPSDLNVDEAVATGAAILAAVKTEITLVRRPFIKLWNVIPQSLGIGTGRGLMYHFITRNTCVPVTKTMLLSTDKDNQTIIRFKVYEGEHTDVSKNYYLGEFRIAGIPPAPRGVPQIEVTFTVDEDCMLQVRAQDLATARTRDLKLQYHHDRLSEKDLEELKARADTFADHTKEVLTRLKALKQLEDFTRAVRVSCMKDPIKSSAPPLVLAKIEDVYKWIDKWHADQSYPTVSTINEKQKELEELWNPFITNFNKQTRRADPPSLFN